MNISRSVFIVVFAGIGLLCSSLLHADTVEIQVYKGNLRISVPDKQARDSLLFEYRSKTREVVRIAIDDVMLTEIDTKKVTRLDDQSANLTNRIDRAGFWNTAIVYDDLNLGSGNYRIEGVLRLYLLGSQRSRNFSVYLKPESGMRPPDSSIDWGIDN
jgi:hypothetical protein